MPRVVAESGLSFFVWVAAASLLAVGAANAHLPGYEGERVRNDNHFTEEGFAWPVRGECDINGFGPTDVDAGSANIYLGPPNIPCSPRNPDPFQCPRQIANPTRPGEIIRLPGQCVDVGTPSEPEQDGEYHGACAMRVPGSLSSSR